MSLVSVAPGAMAAAAAEIASIGANISDASFTAATPTTGVLAAGADEVSAAIAGVFSTHGQQFQTLITQTASFHQHFVHTLTAAIGSYTSAEAGNTAALTANPLQAVQQDLLTAINTPSLAMTQHPLISNGTSRGGAGHRWRRRD
jgi:hypothetical protein